MHRSVHTTAPVEYTLYWMRTRARTRARTRGYRTRVRELMGARPRAKARSSRVEIRSVASDFPATTSDTLAYARLQPSGVSRSVCPANNESPASTSACGHQDASDTTACTCRQAECMHASRAGASAAAGHEQQQMQRL